MSHMKPNPDKHNPDPDYIRELIEKARVKNKLDSQNAVARAIGVSSRSLRYYAAGHRNGKPFDTPYPVQFTLESLVKG